MDPSLYAEFFAIEERHWWSVGMRAAFRTLLADALAERARPRLVDVGCGAGITVKELGRSGAVLGCDLAFPALAHARLRGPDLQLCMADVLHLPLRAGAVDVALALDVIEHLDDDAAALREIHRVLRDGGSLLVNVPAFDALWSEKDVANHHRRRYSRGLLRRRLEECGFAVERLSFTNMTLFPPILVARQLERRLGLRWNRRREYHPDARLNGVLANILRAEARLLRRVDLPIGTSLTGLARKRS
jgi:SAM-dependent methyltransferase